MTEHTDILIVGGGLVGTSLAIALEAAGCRATLVEANAPSTTAQSRPDERHLALARASANGLQHLGVWPRLADVAAPIRRVHVSRAGDFGATRLSADQAGVDALGWTVPASRLGAALQQRVQACAELVRHAPATVAQVAPAEDGWNVRVRDADGDRDIHTRLLVGADGARSMVRDRIGIDADTHDYHQSLFVAAVTPQQAHAGRAFERFTDAGPVAMLPLAGNQAGLVLTVAGDTADDVAAMSDEAFLELAQQRFGWRLGRLLRPGRRFRHDIRSVQARRVTARRSAVIGNAAQSVHPVGAQGFNLGLRDALTLAELVAASPDPGSDDVLAGHAARRAPDREGVSRMSHGLIEYVCREQAALSPLRSLGMLTLDRLGPLRRGMLRRGMGFRGQLPRAVGERPEA